MFSKQKIDLYNPPAKWRGDLEDKLGYDRLEWRKRIAALHSFIDEEDKSVMDLGAGSMLLRRMLSEDVIYYPVDYKKNAEDTIVCDFNKREFPNVHVDVVVAAGILDYIADPEWFLTEISQHCNKLLISYKGLERYGYAALYTRDIISYLNGLGFGMTGQITELDEWTLLACFERITPQKLCKQLNCTGCGCCNNACSAGAVKMDYDEDGYLKPTVDASKCRNCGKCVEYCPALHGSYNEDKYDSPLCYAVQAEDDVRESSSSGGVFSVLSNYFIEAHGHVFGAVWESGFFLKICQADSKEDIKPMRYSKYSQANTNLTFRDVKRLLDNGESVIYFGCPCQIAGLRNYLMKQDSTLLLNENLIMVDLVCFCAPANTYIRKYLEDNFGIENVESVTFRDKNSGWSPYGYKVELKTGEVLYPEFADDKYQQAFHKVLARNDVCENCQYYDIPRQGDITIGDFWGIENYDLSWCDEKGTSIVLINDSKALKFFDEVKQFFKRVEEVPITYSSNRIIDGARPGHPNREYFKKLIKETSFNEAVTNALDGKHDIGLVCMMNLNTGNNLTNYALYRVLTDMGYRVLVISDIKANYPSNDKDERFLRFLRNPYNKYDIAPICASKIELNRFNDKCDAFVVGSDQLFRAEFVEEMDDFSLLDWVSGANYKMSYSTSFGCESYEGSIREKCKMEYLLKRFQRLSVRENSSVRLLRDVFGCDGECVLDPVFLCDKKHYLDMEPIGRMRLPKEKYVGAYILDKSEAKNKVINSLAQTLTDGSHLIINDFYDEENMLKEPSIEEWLAMVSNSEFFVTDSFHGLCFALIFEKQFVVVFDKKSWRGFERIRDILERLSLEDRIIPEDDDCNAIDIIKKNSINYSEVNRKLDEEKNKSFKWLRDALEESRDYAGVYDSQDLVIERRIDDDHILRQISEIGNKALCALRKTKSDLFLLGRSVSYDNYSYDRRKDMTVVGFGAGDCFKRNLESIKMVYDLKYVCDNSPQKWGNDLGAGVICISPKQLAEMNDVLVVIMVDSVKVSFEIADQLRQMGIMSFTHVENWLGSIE